LTHSQYFSQLPFEEEHFKKVVELNCFSALKHFKKIVKSYLFFHLIYLVIFCSEAVLLFLVLQRAKSPHLGLATLIAAIALSLFSYLVLLFYFQAKKPEQMIQLKNWFITMCKKSLPKEAQDESLHLSLAIASSRFVDFLESKEVKQNIFRTPFLLLNQLLKKSSFRVYHHDFFFMNELLLFTCIENYIDLIKLNPTNLEIHAGLAQAYLHLGSLYKKNSEKKFHRSVLQAIEEYKIIHAYASEDPWVIAQLANCYHEIGEIEKEIEEYKKLTEIGEDNPEVLLRLGKLYFKQGKTADGLAIYHRLMDKDGAKAQLLISFYSSHHESLIHL